MTRIIKFLNSFTAIILCIFILLTSVCSFACVTDIKNDNAQFFAASFSLVFRAVPRASLSSNIGLKIVSWIKKKVFSFEEQNADIEETGDFSYIADKPLTKTNKFKDDLYNLSKTTAYFMRI